MKPFVVVVLLSALTTPAFPSDKINDSGNNFLRLCSVVEKPHDSVTTSEASFALVCRAYVGGFIEGLESGMAWAEGMTNTKASPPYCLPDEVGDTQAVLITLKYIRDNPESAHKETAVLITSALRKAFPCSEK